MATDLPTLPNTSAATNTGTSSPTATGATNTQQTSTGTGTQSTSSSGTNTSPTSTSSSSGSAGITDAPSLSTSSGGFIVPSGLPTLSNYFSYPPPAVPDTAQAPYMQATMLPQGFVFIVVGACLAFIALIIVIWRFVAAWSINRNFKRDTSTTAYTPLTDSKKKPTEPSHDMADLSATLPKSFSSVPNLFFSPTAEVARQSMIRPASQHMPAGHYRDASR